MLAPRTGLGRALSGSNVAEIGAQRLVAASPCVVPPVNKKQFGLSSKRNVASWGIAREILARPEVEGDVLQFLDVSEAYLKVSNLINNKCLSNASTRT